MRKINCLVLLLLTMTAMAQSVNLHISDGSTVCYPINGVDYYDFTEAAVPGENPDENYGADNTKDRIVTGGTCEAHMKSITLLGYVNAPAAEYSEVGIVYCPKYNTQYKTMVKATAIDTDNRRFSAEISGLTTSTEYLYYAYMIDDNGMLNCANEQLVCKTSGIEYIYLIGTCNNWIAPMPANEDALADWRLFEINKGSNVFAGTFDVPAGDLQFRFYTYLDNWGDYSDPMGSIGPQMEDAPIYCEFDDKGFFSGYFMQGKGTWRFDYFSGGKIYMMVDLNNWSVQFMVLY